MLENLLLSLKPVTLLFPVILLSTLLEHSCVVILMVYSNEVDTLFGLQTRLMVNLLENLTATSGILFHNVDNEAPASVDSEPPEVKGNASCCFFL